MNILGARQRLAIFLSVLMFSTSSVSQDYITVEGLYSNCTDSSREKLASCHSYIEGVTATFISLGRDMGVLNLDAEAQQKMRRLDSARIVSRFVQKYESGHFSAAGKGASFFVVETVIDIVRD